MALDIDHLFGRLMEITRNFASFVFMGALDVDARAAIAKELREVADKIDPGE